MDGNAVGLTSILDRRQFVLLVYYSLLYTIIVIKLLCTIRASWALVSFIPLDFELGIMRCYFNVSSEADISQLKLPHGTKN